MPLPFRSSNKRSLSPQNSQPSRFLPDLPKLRKTLSKSADARRKSLTMSHREKNVILVLSALCCLFLVCNIPQSICRMMINSKYDFDPYFQACCSEYL